MAIEIQTNDKSEIVSDKEAIFETALRRFQLCEDAEFKQRECEVDDLKFLSGEHWPEDLKRARESEGRPTLVINRLPQHERQITNDLRQNRPSIKVSPVDDKGDKDVAKVLQGIIRHIENASNADVAYDRASQSQVRVGRGYLRLVTEYTDPTSFEQEIRIKSVLNHFSVYLDPAHAEPDGSDANWAFIFEDILPDDYKSMYPKSKLCASMEQFRSVGDDRKNWLTDKSVRIAEYFYKEFKEVDLLLLSDGSTFVNRDGLSEEEILLLFSGTTIVQKRKTKIPVVKWMKMNAVEILDERELPGPYIPIVKFIGNEIIVEGKQIYEGIIRHAKDPQRMYDYWASAETETIALAPKAPWVGYAGQFEGYEDKWATANTKSHPFLEVNPVSINGTLAPLPQRNVFEPATQAITNARMIASDDIKATTGQYDAALGNMAREVSGIAIQRRAIQSQTSNFHFADNFARSIRHLGRIIVQWIPYVYDTARAIRIVGEDGREEIKKINQVLEDGKGLFLGYGKYDVTVSVGPSFETKRQEAVASMIDFTKALPQHAAMIADLLVQNMDWPGAEEVAERLRKLIPPDVLEQKDKEIPIQVQVQMEQQGQLIDALTKQLNELTEELKIKKYELESKERIEMAKIQANLDIEAAKMGSQNAILSIEQKIAQIEERLSLLNFYNPIGDQYIQAPQVPIGEEPQIPFDQTGLMVPDGAEVNPELLNPNGGEFSPEQFMGE